MKAIFSWIALVVAALCIMAYGVHSQNASSPSLDIRILPDQTIEISWPAAAAGYRVETTEQLGSGMLWETPSQPIVATNGQFKLTVSPDALSRYYRLRLQSSVVLPPEPATVAPPVVETAAADVASSTAFLYSGETPIQTGVASGAIVPRQAVVVRGVVQKADGKPLAGVKIQIQDHPEFGQTLSRADGRFDLAANGGSTVFLNYQADGYLAAQRTVNVPWQDYVEAPAVTLLGADSVQTVLKTGAGSTTQIAMGGLVSDASGTRQAAVILPAGVTASIITASGQTQAVSTLTTRFTEYTVGTNGPSAMPGLLPPTVGYTYAVELGSAEAQSKVAGKDVIFDKPVYFYVDNFLGMPAGIAVPMGYYDKTQAAWIPSANGRVIQLKSVNSLGLAGSGCRWGMAPPIPLNLWLPLAWTMPSAERWRIPMRRHKVCGECPSRTSAHMIAIMEQCQRPGRRIPALPSCTTATSRTPRSPVDKVLSRPKTRCFGNLFQ